MMCAGARVYIHQSGEWPRFYWNAELLAGSLGAVHLGQTRLLDAMHSLGFKLQEQAELHTRTADVLMTSEIEGEKLDAEQGANVEFAQVLLVGAGADVKIGAPYVASAKVTATVEKHGKGDKVRIVKFRRRKHYKREGSHRQPYTDVKITSIVA